MNPFDRVNVFDPDIRSRAAYMLLVYKLRNIDRTTRWYANPRFRKRFLDRFRKQHGELYCEYCGRRPLLVDDSKLVKNKNNILKIFLATLDHVVPLSRGGAEFDPANIKLCCPRCNTLKGNKSIKEFELERSVV